MNIRRVRNYILAAKAATSLIDDDANALANQLHQNDPTVCQNRASVRDYIQELDTGVKLNTLFLDCVREIISCRESQVGSNFSEEKERAYGKNISRAVTHLTGMLSENHILAQYVQTIGNLGPTVALSEARRLNMQIVKSSTLLIQQAYSVFEPKKGGANALLHTKLKDFSTAIEAITPNDTPPLPPSSTMKNTQDPACPT